MTKVAADDAEEIDDDLDTIAEGDDMGDDESDAAESSDNVGDASVEINVEALINELEADGLTKNLGCQGARRKLEELMEIRRARRDLEDFDDYDI